MNTEHSRIDLAKVPASPAAQGSALDPMPSDMPLAELSVRQHVTDWMTAVKDSISRAHNPFAMALGGWEARFAEHRPRVLAALGLAEPVTADRLEAIGIDRDRRARLLRRKAIRSVRRGLYSVARPEAIIREQELMALARVPSSVLCLHSARRYWCGALTPVPPDIALAVAKKTRVPRDLPFKVTWLRLEEPLFGSDIKSQSVDGQTVRVYGMERMWVEYFTEVARIGPDHLREAIRAGGPGGRGGAINLDDVIRRVLLCGREVERLVEDGVAWLMGGHVAAGSPFMREIRKWERRQVSTDDGGGVGSGV